MQDAETGRSRGLVPMEIGSPKEYGQSFVPMDVDPLEGCSTSFVPRRIDQHDRCSSKKSISDLLLSKHQTLRRSDRVKRRKKNDDFLYY